jgi:hypothetical protein
LDQSSRVKPPDLEVSPPGLEEQEPNWASRIPEPKAREYPRKPRRLELE